MKGLNKNTQVSIGLGTLATLIMGIVLYFYNDLKDTMKADKKEAIERVEEEEEKREKWIENKYDKHIESYNKTDKDVGILLERTNSLHLRTNSIGTHNIEATPPPN